MCHVGLPQWQAAIEIPTISALKSLVEGDPGLPADRFKPRDIDDLAWRAVGFRAVEMDRSAKADDATYELRKFGDPYLATATKIDDLLVRVVFHQEDHPIARVAAMKEPTHAPAGSPS